MSGLKLIVTTAGRAKLPNAENTGTQAVTITHVGVTASAFTAKAHLTELPGELKRMATLSGAAVAPDTMHLMIRDDSTDSYSMRGFALYLDDGTLFALYGQPGVILEKSAQAMMLLATDTVFADIDAASIVFGDALWNNPPATTETLGVVELATDTEAEEGFDAARAVTPRGMKHALDSRFGFGAPTTLAKTLLSLATAALMRTAIGIKSAALRDEGSGNGLDADLLDGQHGAYYRAWGSLTGVPASFPPAAHGHQWIDISGVPVQATRWPTWGEVTGKPTTFAPADHSHSAAEITAGTFANARVAQSNVTQHQAALSITWSQLSGVPATFAPSAHTHPWNQVTGAPATATRWPTWGEVSGKPATFAPSAHTHAVADVTGLQAALDSKPGKGANTFTGVQTATGFTVSSSRALKTDIQALDLLPDLIDLFQPVTFRYKAALDREVAGLIREEVSEIFPLACTEEGIDYGQLVPLLIATIQHDRAQLRDLASRVAKLEGEAA